jgi:hypothetical protein
VFIDGVCAPRGGIHDSGQNTGIKSKEHIHLAESKKERARGSNDGERPYTKGTDGFLPKKGKEKKEGRSGKHVNDALRKLRRRV